MPRRGESIYKRKDGRWEARYIHHYENGRACYRSLYASTYSAVRSKRAEAVASNAQIPHTAGQVNFSELAALWLAERAETIKESSYTRYHRIVYRYLIPRIGTTPIQRLDTRALTTLSRELSCSGGVRSGPLSPKTVGDICTVLRAILTFGRSRGYPCPDPATVPTTRRERKRIEILPETVRIQLERNLWATDDRTGIGILLALYTGLRLGELCGLRWADFDWLSNSVTIRRTVERIANLSPGATTKTKVVITSPKTANAERIIPLPAFLAEHIAAQRKNNADYILTGNETPTEPHSFYLRYRTYLRRLDLPPYTFHALRHTFATRCVAEGFDTKSLSELLGHANISTTLSLYVHPTLEQKRRQMERLAPTLIPQTAHQIPEQPI